MTGSHGPYQSSSTKCLLWGPGRVVRAFAGPPDVLARCWSEATKHLSTQKLKILFGFKFLIWLFFKKALDSLFFLEHASVQFSSECSISFIFVLFVDY